MKIYLEMKMRIYFKKKDLFKKNNNNNGLKKNF